MKNNKNKKTKMRKLIPAIGMLAISATMLSTSTYAWFTMNKEVSVTNMVVQAKADQGLLINEIDTANDANWDESATANQTTGVKLHATSTADTKTWYVAYSTKANSAAAATEGEKSPNLADNTYYTLGTNSYTTSTHTLKTATAGVNAKTEVTYVDKDGDGNYTEGEGYYVKYTYYLKSSADAITCTNTGKGQSLYIKNVTVNGNNNYGVADPVEDLDAALRVAIVVNNKAYIYAPVDGATTSYYVNADSTVTTTLSGDQPTAMTSIPAVTENGDPVYVYLYFEGEDAKLKTDNVTENLDNLTVSFDFALVDHEDAVTDKGVTVPA